MRNSSHLLDPFRDADHLFSLELEVLAKHLLDYLDGGERIQPSEIISEELLFLKPEIGQRFPSKRKEILFALMEAWHCFDRKGFIAPRPRVCTRICYESRILCYEKREGWYTFKHNLTFS